MTGDRGGAAWRVVIYNRASADKAGQRVSVESQDAENRAWCEREGWQVVATVSDSNRSASRYAKRQREGYQQVLAGLADGRWGRVDALVLWESSRGERTVDGHVEMRALCQQVGVKLAYKGRILDMNDGDDRFTAGLDALLDEREAERARERTKRSHLASVRAGKPRSVVPYGYRREYAPGSGHMVKQVPDPATASVVTGIVADVLAGKTLYAIAQQLNRDGVRTPKQVRDERRKRPVGPGGWTSTIIRNLLRRRSLMGERTHNGVVTGPGTWEPIVSPRDWDAVQALLNDPHRVRHHGGREVRHLLSGIAECGVCGAWLRPMRNRDQMTYVCAGLTPTSPKAHVVRTAKPLEAFVVLHVVARLADPTLGGLLQQRDGGGDAVAAAIHAEIADLEAQLGDAKRAVMERTISFESFGEFEAQLRAGIAAARRRLSARVPLPAAVLEAAGPDAQEWWDSPRVQGDLELQRTVVRALVRVRVHRSVSRGVRGFDGSSVEVGWRFDD